MLGRLYESIADNTNPNSLSSRFRRRRFELFKKLLSVQNGETILDVGGTEATWLNTGMEENVTLLNIRFDPKPKLIKFVEFSACDMRVIRGKAYNIVYSNSVIEHVGTLDAQRAFANEVRRVSDRYWVQTPSKYFPVEPHFCFPFFEFLPENAKRFIGLRWPYSHLKRNNENILDELARLKLLGRSELQMLFPDARVLDEKFLTLTKSIVAYKEYSDDKL